MRVSKITARNFGVHAEVDVTLPDTGVVVVTGQNGQGKSTLVEAVCHGLWGTSLRGAPSWRAGESGGVEIEFDDGHVARAVNGSTHKLTWHVGSVSSAGMPTRAKSQEALTGLVGQFHVWRSACTFHTRDAARFTSATDAERKALLEEVLELGCISDARAAVSEARVKAEVAVIDANSKVMNANHGLAIIDQALRFQSEAMEDHEDLSLLRAEWGRMEAQRKAARLELDQAIEQRRAVSDDMQRHNIERIRITTQIDAMHRMLSMGEHARCDKCDQEIDRQRLIDNIDGQTQLVQQLAEAYTHATERFSAADTVVERLTECHSEILVAQNSISVRGEVAKKAQARNEKRAGEIHNSQVEREKAAEVLAEAHREQAAAERREDVLRYARDVLAPTGVQAAIFHAAVSALQDLANDWLARLGMEHMTVELASQTAQKSGKVTEKISLTVHGAGGGAGYAGASTGEQRRIDIAMMFALSELSAQSRGLTTNSTLFVDELFDGLDHDGQDAVASMLIEAAATRCIVVITHNRDLVARLRPALHLVAQDRTLKEASWTL